MVRSLAEICRALYFTAQADVDRHLRLLCLGLADGLAQALYLKQMQAEVAASEMVMQVGVQLALLLLQYHCPCTVTTITTPGNDCGNTGIGCADLGSVRYGLGGVELLILIHGGSGTLMTPDLCLLGRAAGHLPLPCSRGA